MTELRAEPGRGAGQLGELTAGILLLLFGGLTVTLIRALDVPPIGRLDLLLHALSMAMLATALAWLFVLALRRGVLWWMGMLIPYLNLLVAGSFARRYWNEGARAPALLALLGMLLQTLAVLRMLTLPLVPFV